MCDHFPKFAHDRHITIAFRSFLSFPPLYCKDINKTSEQKDCWEDGMDDCIKTLLRHALMFPCRSIKGTERGGSSHSYQGRDNVADI